MGSPIVWSVGGRTLPLGVTGNTPDSGSGESWFDPRRGNSKPGNDLASLPGFLLVAGIPRWEAYGKRKDTSRAVSLKRRCPLNSSFSAPRLQRPPRASGGIRDEEAPPFPPRRAVRSLA